MGMSRSIENGESALSHNEIQPWSSDDTPGFAREDASGDPLVLGLNRRFSSQSDLKVQDRSQKALALDSLDLQGLTEEEQARLARFYFEKDQWSFMASRQITRKLFCENSPGTSWQDWLWSADANGKPQLVQATRKRDWSFNITHTENAVACVIRRGPEVGVDLESWDRRVEEVPLSKRFFAKQESQALLAWVDHPVELRRRFFAYWTLKEAFVKTIGMGLRFPLDHFWFDLPETIPSSKQRECIQVPLRWNDAAFEAYEELTQKTWDLRLWSWPPNHWVATGALVGESDPLYRVRIF